MNEFITISQLSNMLGVCEDAARLVARKHNIGKDGGRPAKYLLSDVEKLNRERRQGPDDQADYYTIAQGAKALGVSRTKFWYMCKMSQPASKKFGRWTYFLKKDVDKMKV